MWTAATVTNQQRFMTVAQVSHQLLALLSLLLPSLRLSALRSCPAWATAAVPVDATARRLSGRLSEVAGEGSESGDEAKEPDASSHHEVDGPALLSNIPLALRAEKAGHHSRTGSQTEASTATGGGGGGTSMYITVAELDTSVEGRSTVDAMFGAWAGERRRGQWKALHWTVHVSLYPKRHRLTCF